MFVVWATLPGLLTANMTTNVVSPMLHAILLPKLLETSVKFHTTPRIVFTMYFVHLFTKFEEQKEARDP